MTAVNRRGQRVLLRNKDDRRVVSTTSLQNSSLIHYCLVCGEPNIDLARNISCCSVAGGCIVWVFMCIKKYERRLAELFAFTCV